MIVELQNESTILTAMIIKKIVDEDGELSFEANSPITCLTSLFLLHIDEIAFSDSTVFCAKAQIEKYK